jgi:hypothetical protein
MDKEKHKTHKEHEVVVFLHALRKYKINMIVKI